MKKRTWTLLILIALCIGVFVVYRTVDALGTDRKAPAITVSKDVPELSTKSPESELLRGITAQDDKDGDVTASIVVEGLRLVDNDGTAEVTCAAFDSAGNVAKTTRQVRFTDYVSPRFSLIAPLAFTQNTAANVLSRITVTDVFDGDISRKVRGTSLSKDGISGVGVHDVALRVSNSLGDTVELVLPVEIYPAGVYQASLELKEYLVYLSVGTRFDAKAYLEAFAVGNNRVSLASGVPGELSLRTTGSVNIWEPGVYSVSYTLTDEMGLSGYSRLIVIVEE